MSTTRETRVLIDSNLLCISSLADGISTEGLVTQEGSWGLVVNRSQGRDIADQLIHQTRCDPADTSQSVAGSTTRSRNTDSASRFNRDRGLLRQHHGLCSLGIRGEQSPVNVRSITGIWVIDLLCGSLKNSMDQFLRCRGLFQKQLDGSSQQLELNLRVFFQKCFQERLDQLDGVIDSLSIFSQNPDQ